MRAFKRRLQRMVLAALHRSGLLDYLADRKLEGKVVVLMYHRVLPVDRQQNSFSAPGIVVTPATFQRHVQFLGSRFNVLDPDRFLRCLRSEEPWPRRACLITFDDGWHDNLEFAHPILNSSGLRAVLFAAGNYIDSADTFWQEKLSRALYARWMQRSLPSAVSRQIGGRPDVSKLEANEARTKIWEFVQRIKEDRATMLPKIIEALGGGAVPAGQGEDHFLGWQALRQMEEDGSFVIASHAMSHIPLTELAPDAVSAELARSRDLLGANLNRSPPMLAYPNGNHDDTVVELSRKAGFSAAFTTVPGLFKTGTDPLRIPRFNVSESSMPDEATLLGRIAGLI